MVALKCEIEDATMKVVPLVLSTISLGLLSAFGEPSTVIGSIDRITGSNITVKTARGLFFIHADERTETLKDKTYRGFSALKLGDEISIRCQPDVSDKLVAVKIWAKVITFSAIVKHVNSIISRPWPPALDEIEVVTIPNAE
jgi:hypothetical protein